MNKKYICEHKKEIRSMMESKPRGTAFSVATGESQRFWDLREKCCHYPEKPKKKWWKIFK